LSGRARRDIATRALAGNRNWRVAGCGRVRLRWIGAPDRPGAGGTSATSCLLDCGRRDSRHDLYLAIAAGDATMGKVSLWRPLQSPRIEKILSAPSTNAADYPAMSLDDAAKAFTRAAYGTAITLKGT